MYYLHYKRENHDPYLIDQIKTMWASGVITADAVYWNEATEGWQPITELLKSNGRNAAEEPKIPPPSEITIPHGVSAEAKSSSQVAPGEILAQKQKKKTSGCTISVLIFVLAWFGVVAITEYQKQKQEKYQDEMAQVVREARSPLHSTAVDMVSDGGVLKVPVQINGAISLKFVVDSGASDVHIPRDVFLTLMRAETIKEGDFLPGRTFVLADGSKVKSDRFKLRSIKVGESIFSDVEASVGGLDAQLLLGQSFLSRFGEWKIDNRNAKLMLTK